MISSGRSNKSTFAITIKTNLVEIATPSASMQDVQTGIVSSDTKLAVEKTEDIRNGIMAPAGQSIQDPFEVKLVNADNNEELLTTNQEKPITLSF